MKAYEGLIVLELAQGVAAPYCGMLLAQHGADVLKVEPLSGDWSRGLGQRFGDLSSEAIVLNRGKASLGLDLKAEMGRALAVRLAAGADVVIENYRPGVTARLGLDEPSVRAQNPRVVYATVTGFGPEGPRRDRPATDTVMQGYTGFMQLNRDGEGMPRRLNMLAIDISTGLYLSQAVGAALYRRAQTGEGARIETSLLECAMAFQEARLVAHVLEGEAVRPVGAPVGTFATADGYLSLNARRDAHFAKLCELLGTKDWQADDRFRAEQDRVSHAAALNALVAPHMAKRPTAAWVEALSQADILHAPVQTYDDLMADEQVGITDAIAMADTAGLGALPATRLPGLPGPSQRERALAEPPVVGEGARAALARRAVPSDEIAALVAAGVAKAA